MALAASGARGQTTRTPVFHAPVRAFERYEVGASGSLVEYEDAAFEGQLGVGIGRADLTVRGGYVRRDPADGAVVLGVTGRVRALGGDTAPFAAAVVLGAGTSAFTALFVPVGLSVGRRVGFPGGSAVVYVQPAAALLLGADDVDGNRDLRAGVGMGVDLRLGRAFDLRTAVGVGRYAKGASVGLAWVR